MKNLLLFLLLFLALIINVKSKPEWELFAFKDYSIRLVDVDYNDNLYISIYDKLNDKSSFYKSSDDGNSWDEIIFDSRTFPDCMVNIRDSIIILGTSSGGDRTNNKYLSTMRSNDGGKTWINITKGLELSFSVTDDIYNIIYDKKKSILYAAGLSTYKSTDLGLSWKVFCTPGYSDNYGLAVDSSGYIYASDMFWFWRINENCDGYFDINNAKFIPDRPWYQSPIPLEVKKIIVAINKDIYAGGQSFNLCRSSDNGYTWNCMDSLDQIEDIIEVTKGKIFITTVQQGVYFIENYGNIWHKFNEGLNLDHNHINMLALSKKGILYGASYNGLYRTIEPVTSTNAVENKIENNPIINKYPNPLQPGKSLNISLSLESAGEVSISLYDALGQQSGNIYRKYLDAGAHTLQYTETGGLLTGIYFLRIITGDKVWTVKVAVIR